MAQYDNDLKEKPKWQKKSTKDVNYIAEGEFFVEKVFQIKVYVHRAAFTTDLAFMDYVEYRLNLDRGTKGLIILENIEILEGSQ